MPRVKLLNVAQVITRSSPFLKSIIGEKEPIVLIEIAPPPVTLTIFKYLDGFTIDFTRGNHMVWRPNGLYNILLAHTESDIIK